MVHTAPNLHAIILSHYLIGAESLFFEHVLLPPHHLQDKVLTPVALEELLQLSGVHGSLHYLGRRATQVHLKCIIVEHQFKTHIMCNRNGRERGIS